MDDKSSAVVSLVNDTFDCTVTEFVGDRWRIGGERVERIITDSLDESDVDYVESHLGSMSHYQDSRSPVEYGQELIRGWLIEEVVVEVLHRDTDMTVSLAGSDANRAFLSDGDVSAKSDLSVEFNGTEYAVEVVSDYTGFWRRNEAADLRDSKYSTIVSESNPILVGLDLDSQSGFITQPEKAEKEFMDSHPYWGKPATRIFLGDTEFVAMDSLPKELKKTAYIYS